ncbi:MAG: hypothetical protein AAF226_17175, partial [Verrucomicrobiota bacterium]
MNRALIHKELRQHGIWLGLLGLIVWGLVLLQAIAFFVRGQGGGSLNVLGSGYYFTLPLAGLILAHLLVAIEFRYQTQIFLEGLPLPRWRMLAIKAVIGHLCMVLYAWGGVVIAWLFS